MARAGMMIYALIFKWLSCFLLPIACSLSVQFARDIMTDKMVMEFCHEVAIYPDKPNQQYPA